MLNKLQQIMPHIKFDKEERDKEGKGFTLQPYYRHYHYRQAIEIYTGEKFGL